MPRRSARARRTPVRRRRTRRRGIGSRRLARLRSLLPSPARRRRARQRAWRRFRRSWAPLQASVALLCLVLVWIAVNGVYQVIRKPTELFFPVSGTLHKTPTQTWRAYAPLFRRHSTAIISPELLAALAQVEGSGNPVVRTYWRWAWRLHPFEVYRPASSAVGMYQITDGTFERARRYCIHDHVVVEDGPWHDWRSCWFNAFYFRVVPSHAIEMTSAFLDHTVRTTLARHRIASATGRQKQRLAALIHLCGSGAGDRHVRRGLVLTPGQRCGSHDLRGYLDRVERMRGVFEKLAAQET